MTGSVTAALSTLQQWHSIEMQREREPAWAFYNAWILQDDGCGLQHDAQNLVTGGGLEESKASLWFVRMSVAVPFPSEYLSAKYTSPLAQAPPALCAAPGCWPPPRKHYNSDDGNLDSQFYTALQQHLTPYCIIASTAEWWWLGDQWPSEFLSLIRVYHSGCVLFFVNLLSADTESLNLVTADGQEGPGQGRDSKGTITKMM